MLSKNKIDEKLKKYVKEHLSKGYSKNAVKHVLVTHGYNENYVDGLLKKHSELQTVKAYSILVSLLFIISFFAVNTFNIKEKQQQITGYAVSNLSEGCCTSICQQTSKNECYGKFVDGKNCNELEECNVACCIDKEGYCLTNYLSGNCIRSLGRNINRDCNDIIFCRNITDKSYAAREYSIKNKKGSGTSVLKPAADYYNSSFNIQYYLYDKTNVLSVSADIKEKNNTIDSIALYDDGFHNDGSKNDNLYGNNWLSSKIKDFEGFKKLDIDIIVEYEDGTKQAVNKTQSITILSNNKCLPVYNEWSDSNNRHSIIFAADNYEALNDGYQKFETDVQNFLNAFFSIEKFRRTKDDFNTYRLESSLSYFNIPTLSNIVSNYCPLYSNKKDLIVVLDNNEQYCTLESSRVIRVNPQVLFYSNITNPEINATFADFCSYVLTPKKLADSIISFATPPVIDVNTLTNVTYDSSSVNLSFEISSVNYPVNYSVLVEDMQILSKITGEPISDYTILNLTNGTNAVLIKAVDINRNKAFAPLLINTTIE